MNAQASNKQIELIKNWLGSGSINIFGTPFAGKDTQGKKLAELFDAPLVGGGDIIRSSLHEDVKQIIAKGKLAPTDQFLAIVTPYFSKAEFSNKPLILSSVGRWQGEEKVVVEAAKKANHPIKAVIFLQLSEDQVHERWKLAHQSQDRGQRDDDADGILDTRFSEFHNKTLPVVDFYRKLGLLVEVDGSQSREQVTKDILNGLANLSST